MKKQSLGMIRDAIKVKQKGITVEAGKKKVNHKNHDSEQ